MATLSSDAFDQEALRGVVAGVLWNAANYPLKAQPYLLGTDTAPLTDKVTNAVIAHLSAQQDLPDGAVESHRIIARAYITREGKSGYSIHTRGEATASSFLGLLIFAQQDVLAWSEGDE